MASRKEKVIEQLIKCIEHDFGFYNPIWKWNSLPKNIRNNYDLIEEKLLIWEREGYISMFKENDILYMRINKVPQV